MAVHYETQFTNVGGRVGESVAVDNTFKLDQPGEDGKMAPGATNPEQLFAASLASCYNGAFLYHMEAAGKKSDVKFIVTVYLEDDPNYEGTMRVRAVCKVNAPELTKEEIKDFLEKAQTTSPYTKMFNGGAILENVVE
ncbi:MAG: OsmC family protein [Clostridia bacterium]|nr:OsmC family protein [Clostridiales bacterium]MDU2293114.1 OsmC family protein [Peptococcus niger]MDU7244565.1 OsmC family protein [Clostridiales bacterium]MDU7505268.1 OsmC family protein [Clostridia bacterium]